jgi:uncharacterized protein (DUF2237 family)
MARNVLGTDLVPCGFEPLTGFYRNGCCDTGDQDPDSSPEIAHQRALDARSRAN